MIWQDNDDTKRLDAIASGFCVAQQIHDGVEIWLCQSYSFDGIAVGNNIREAIDHGIKLRDMNISYDS